MKRIFLLTAALLIGCTTTVSPTQSYRPANYPGAAWSIGARSEGGTLSDEITVTINGQAIANGTLNELKPSDNFTGTFEGRNILAECSLVNSGQLTYGHECIVFVDNERAAQLSF